MLDDRKLGWNCESRMAWNDASTNSLQLTFADCVELLRAIVHDNLDFAVTLRDESIVEDNRFRVDHHVEILQRLDILSLEILVVIENGPHGRIQISRSSTSSSGDFPGGMDYSFVEGRGVHCDQS
jgi:hypothetical protein